LDLDGTFSDVLQEVFFFLVAIEIYIHDVYLSSLVDCLTQNDLFILEIVRQLVRNISEDGRVSKPDRDSTSLRIFSDLVEVTVLRCSANYTSCLLETYDVGIDLPQESEEVWSKRRTVPLQDLETGL
jgi:hypothetical protein